MLATSLLSASSQQLLLSPLLYIASLFTSFAHQSGVVLVFLQWRIGSTIFNTTSSWLQIVGRRSFNKIHGPFFLGQRQRKYQDTNRQWQVCTLCLKLCSAHVFFSSHLPFSPVNILDSVLYSFFEDRPPNVLVIYNFLQSNPLEGAYCVGYFERVINW